jgi:hypothetical protein
MRVEEWPDSLHPRMPRDIVRQLGYYVYIYVDPRNGLQVPGSASGVFISHLGARTRQDTSTASLQHLWGAAAPCTMR